MGDNLHIKNKVICIRMKIKKILFGLSVLPLLLKHYLLGICYPLDVSFSITHRCNNKCRYCKIEKNLKCEELKTNQIISMIDELKKNGLKRLSITGGDPLLRGDIKEIIDYCHLRNIFISLGTNGKLVPKRVSELKNLDALVFSLDGPKKVHDFLRGNGSYDSVIRAIKVAKKSGLNVITNTVLTKQNVKHLSHLFKKSEELGFMCSFQSLHHPRIIAGDTKRFLPNKKEVDEAIQYIKKQKGILKNVINSKHYLSILSKLNEYCLSKNPCKKVSGIYFRKIKCFGGRLHCHITANGDVYPCSKTVGYEKTYNFFDFDFKEITRMILGKKRYCSALCGNVLEYNLLFSMDLDSITNAFKFMKIN